MVPISLELRREEHILLGTGLTAVVVWLFLVNLRSTLIIAAAIPVSLLGAVAVMYFSGYTFNTMTLLGLLLLIGVVVDDAIFVDRSTLSARMGEGAERRAVHEAMLRQTAAHGVAVVAQVKALLSTLVRHDACTIDAIDAIGAALAISPRTLQRRLTAAGTSYRALVDEVRADLAWRHVKRSELGLGRIAELLGYRSPAAFSRAFRRWHRTSPRAARRG